jgi:hypothetical protein
MMRDDTRRLEQSVKLHVNLHHLPAHQCWIADLPELVELS